MATAKSAPSKRVATLLHAMTLEEKVALLSGKNMWETHDIPRLGIRSLKTTDGPAGVRGAKWTNGTRSTSIPCGISLGATFDPPLVESLGRILGDEAKSKKAHVLLAPTMNMSRSPLGGRNFENFGEDTFLTGTMATSLVRGVQSQGVGACPKHYVGNEQESRRFNVDEKIDERTLREVYLRPFQMVCEADPWTFMTAYNKVNGEHCDMSKRLVQNILKEEWAFGGVVMSDWGGLNDTVQSVLAGTDLEMPGPPIRRGKPLLEAVKADLVKETDIDVCVQRMLQLLEKAGCLEQPGQAKSEKIIGRPAAVNATEESADRDEARLRAKEAAVGGMVLLENNGILPLCPSDIRSIAVIGPNAKTPTIGGAGSAVVNPYYISTPFESIAAIARSENISTTHETGVLVHRMLPLVDSIKNGENVGVQLDFYAGHKFEGDVIGSRDWTTTQIMMMSDGDIPETLRGKDYSFRVTGTYTVPKSGAYSVGISSTGKAKLFIDDVLVVDNSDWTELGEGFFNCGSKERIATMNLEKGHAYAVRIDQIAVPPPVEPHDNTLFHTVSGIRLGILAPVDEDAMLAAAVKSAENADVAILVVGHNNGTEREGSDRTSLDLPGRTAELVHAVCAVNKRTIVVNQSACAVDLHALREEPAAIIQAWYQGQETGNAVADVLFGKANPSGKLPITFPRRLEDHGSHPWFPGEVENDRTEYGEGIQIGYRWFDKKDIQPAWEFGYGASYTTFALADVNVHGSIEAEGSCGTATISLSVTNTGDLAGAEVVQVYASPSMELIKKGLDTAPKSLVGVRKVFLDPKQTETVAIEVGQKAVEWYDVDKSRWAVDRGMYMFHIGTSSRRIVAGVYIEVL